jgi:hypothetical protein
LKTLGEIQAAIIWAEDNNEEGGMWLPLAELNVLQPNAQDDEKACSKNAEKPDQEEQDVAMHNWETYFGRRFEEAASLLVCWQSGEREGEGVGEGEGRAGVTEA